MQVALGGTMFPVRIGTRGSRLALAQAREVRARLSQAMHADTEAFEIVPIQTKGDKERDRPLGDIGGQGLFCREIEDALLDGAINVAVHSLKDMPTIQPPGLVIDCVLPREDPCDALVSYKYSRIEDLPAGAVVGTSSVRRRAQLLRRNPKLKVIEFRGNVDTRMRKLSEGRAAATVLASAGIKRLGVPDVPWHRIPSAEMLPAPGQGAICVECREGDAEMLAQLSKVGDLRSFREIQAERAFVLALGGGCQTPVGALACERDGVLELRGEILSENGADCRYGSVAGEPAEGAEIGFRLAMQLKAEGGLGDGRLC